MPSHQHYKCCPGYSFSKDWEVTFEFILNNIHFSLTGYHFSFQKMLWCFLKFSNHLLLLLKSSVFLKTVLFPFYHFPSKGDLSLHYLNHIIKHSSRSDYLVIRIFVAPFCYSKSLTFCFYCIVKQVDAGIFKFFLSFFPLSSASKIFTFFSLSTHSIFA